MLTRLEGAALMRSPLITTVWSRCAGRLNSETPISEKVFFPAGGAAGRSFAAGAFAVLGTGSVAATSVHVFGGDCFRQPVMLTISTFCGACAAPCRGDCSASSRRKIVMRPYDTAVTRPTEGTQSAPSPQKES